MPTTPYTIEPGWQIIEPKDHCGTIRSGDEFWSGDKWYPTKLTDGCRFVPELTYRRRIESKPVEQSGFWFVMRLGSNGVQQIDSLPHKRYAFKFEADDEAQRLADKFPNAKGFVVLQSCETFKCSKSAAELAFEEWSRVANQNDPEHWKEHHKMAYLAGYDQGKADK